MKRSNKQSSLKCDRCYHYFRYTEMYAIGHKYGQVCNRCWQITMEEIIEEQKKQPKETERQFNLGGYDNQIYKSNTEKD